MVAVMFGVLVVLVWQITETRHLAVEHREQRYEARLELCVEVEQLKAARRADARESFRRLDETLMLLGVETTPQIVRRARDNRDETLEQFRQRGAPGKTLLQACQDFARGE